MGSGHALVLGISTDTVSFAHACMQFRIVCDYSMDIGVKPISRVCVSIDHPGNWPPIVGLLFDLDPLRFVNAVECELDPPTKALVLHLDSYRDRCIFADDVHPLDEPVLRATSISKQKAYSQLTLPVGSHVIRIFPKNSEDGKQSSKDELYLAGTTTFHQAFVALWHLGFSDGTLTHDPFVFGSGILSICEVCLSLFFTQISMLCQCDWGMPLLIYLSYALPFSGFM